METHFRPVHVRDFGAVANDGLDHSADIQKAIDAALASGHPVVEFDPGEYIVTGITGRSPFNDRKVCLQIDGVDEGFTLRGAVDAAGKPATFLIYDEPGPRFSVDYWLWVSRSRNVTVENLVLDFPGAMASGRIAKVADGKTWVELWPEVVKPRGFIKGAEYVFLYDPDTGDMLHPKITLGGGWDEVRAGPPLPEVDRNTPFASLTEGHGFVIDAELGEPGMGLVYPVQWHHAPEKTAVFNRVENLTLRNLTLVQALGHCLLPVGCKNITVEKLRFDPGGRGTHRGWVARRDGLTMRACRGKLRVEDSLFQCASDDLLAFWGFQFSITKIVSPTKIVVASHQCTGDYFLDFPVTIEPGDWIEYRLPDGEDWLPLSGRRSTIKSSRFVIDRTRRMPWKRHFAEEIEREAWEVGYELELNEPIPDFIRNGSPKIVMLGSTLFDSAVLRRVTARNVTNHPGVLIPGTLNYDIEDCCFGTEVRIQANTGSTGWHGGSGAWNAVLRRNIFTSSPVVPNRKGLHLDGVFALEPRGQVLVEKNTFLNGAWIKLGGSQPVTIRDNEFVTEASEPPVSYLEGRHRPEVLVEGNRMVAPEDTEPRSLTGSS